MQRSLHRIRHPKAAFEELTGGGPVFPLLILFGFMMVESFDRNAFGILVPNIRDAFGLTNAVILGMAGVAGAVGLFMAIPVAQAADRFNRVRILLIGTAMLVFFNLATGVAVTVWMLWVARAGTGAGLATSLPTHNSLIADYYEMQVRPGVLSFHRSADAIGALISPVLAGVIAYNFGWRVPFFVFTVPAVVLLIIALRLHEPVRGLQERKAMGASEEVMNLEEKPPSFEEAKRMVMNIDSLRRIFYALPFLAISLFGFISLAALLYSDVYQLNEVQRGWIQSATEPLQLVGLVIGGVLGTRLVRRDPSLIIRFVGVLSFFAAVLAAVFALSPVLWVGVVANMLIAASLAAVLPGVFAALTLAIPPRVRSIGFSLAAQWLIPGLFVLPFVGWVSDHWGIRTGMLMMTPMFVVGGCIIASAHKFLDADIKSVWGATAARSEVLYDRRQGKTKLLLVRGLDVKYGDVQILFDVDFEIDQGEIVALLGTNGAGKSTLLKAICGVVQASKGVVVFDGDDVTHAPPHEVAFAGITQVPGGQGVFPSLTVAENLRVAGWLERRRAMEEGIAPERMIERLTARITRRGAAEAAVKVKIAKVLEMFPILEQRLEDPAANLSGGQQQMLALGMAFLSRPRLLMIDELSLGLAPVIVEQLLTIVRAIRDQGTTIILVEQSVNVALTLAETAYFMEKGEIRFHGPTAELLERPDVLRSVFLEGAEKGMNVVTEVPEAPGAGNGDQAGATAAPAAAEQAFDRNGTPAIEVQDLSVRFGGIRAVDGVSLAVAPGEIVGIIGPNGAGKTTLFDLISGFTKNDGGRVLLAGNDITALGPDGRARAGLGRSFQDARLFPALTVEDAIAVALERWIEVRDPFNAALRLPAQQDSERAVAHRVDELVELMGIDTFRSKFVHELSTGSRRVVDLACVLAHHPSVVLLDEPSSGIAQKEAEALGPLIKRIRDTLGASIIVIEHDMPLITAVADRLMALDQGHVVTIGTSDEVLNHPEVVASYLGGSEEVIARSGSRGAT